MKRFIFFRVDRLGDFIIITNILKKIKKDFKNCSISVVCSPLNYKLVKSYEIIDKVYVYDKNKSFLSKIKLIRKICNFDYYASFSTDGKTFSNICNSLINAKIKLGLIYRQKFMGFWLTKPNFIYKHLFFNEYETFTSKKDLLRIEHLPSKLNKISNFLGLNNKSTEKYFFKPSLLNEKSFKTLFNKKIKKKYILFHLDEKWIDIKNIENELYENLIFIQKKLNLRVVLTSFNNNFTYFIKLKQKINSFKPKNIIILNNCNLFIFERLINYSQCSVSCHSGFVVQIAGCNSTKLFDLINKKDYIWYSCWKPKNTFHKFLYKSGLYKKRSVNIIFKDIYKQFKINNF